MNDPKDIFIGNFLQEVICQFRTLRPVTPEILCICMDMIHNMPWRLARRTPDRFKWFEADLTSAAIQMSKLQALTVGDSGWSKYLKCKLEEFKTVDLSQQEFKDETENQHLHRLLPPPCETLD